LEIRDNAAGEVYNSIFVEMSKSIMDIEATSSSKGTVSDTNSSLYGSQALLQNGTLEFKGNIFYNGGKGNTALGTAEDDQIVADVIGLAGNSNSFDVDPLLLDTSSRDGVVAPFPYNDASNTSPALTAGVTLPGAIFQTAAYKGAFASSAASDNWLAGWSSIGGDSATAGSTPILAVDFNGSSSSATSTASYNLLGISTRGLVSSTKSMYGSIAITGTGNKTVAFMGKGQTMLAQGVTDYVADPKIEIWRQVSGQWELYKSNDNWASASATEIITTVTGKTGITLPVGANEAAIVLSLAPGNYSAILKSDNSTAQEGLVEAYEIAE
jgi:hypothetical protein